MLCLGEVDDSVAPWTDDGRPPGQLEHWGPTLRRDLIALDALMARPEIDPKRVAVAGVGLGALAPGG